MGIELRKARSEDKPRIVEISSQIWEGTDYVPLVFDDWLSDTEGEFVVAVVDGVLVGFAHRTYLAPGYAWLEGIRTDPARRGTGAAKEITRHFLEGVREEGADRVGLSTHIENEASIHIIRSNGFEEVAWFTNVGGAKETPTWPEARPSKIVCEVPLAEAMEFVRRSHSLEIGRGFVPNGWTFHPFDRAPEAALSSVPHLLGVRDRGRLIGFLAGGYARQGILYPIHFLEGTTDAAEELVRHALSLAATCRYVDLMGPGPLENGLGLLPILTQLGFKPWAKSSPDVLIFERRL